MNQDILTLILSIVALTIVFVVIVLLISMSFTRFKTKIEKFELDHKYKKELPHREIKFYSTSIKPTYNQGFVEINKYTPYIKSKGLTKANSYKEYYYYENEEDVKKKIKWNIFKIIFSILFYLICIGLIAFGLVYRFNNDLFTVNNETYITIKTGSMSEANEANEYLKENELTNQIPTYSFIGLEKVTKTSELKLYDIAAYKDQTTGELIVHRIIDVDIRNGERYFTFRGDANLYSDYYLVNEDDVLYKYNGYINTPLGYFFTFISSYQGVIAIAYSILALNILDYYEHKKQKLFVQYRSDAINRINYNEYLTSLSMK